MDATRRRLLLAAAVLVAGGSPAGAQQADRSVRVGWIGYSPGTSTAIRSIPLEGFRAGLREGGWIEGRNLVLEVRAGDRDKAAGFSEALVKSNANVIVALGPMISGARTQSGATPLVFGMTGDPVEMRLVASLARPGGSLTGVTSLALELEAKRLELLKAALPKLSRVAVLANARHPGVKPQLGAAQAAAGQLGLALQFVPVQGPGDFGAAFESIRREGAEAILAFPDSLIHRQAEAIAEFAARHRIPAISGWAEFVEAGKLLSYGPNEYEFYRRLAAYVDRILRGARPAELPVEQPAKLEFVVNLKTARAQGIAIPQSVLLRADRVIE